VSDETRVARDRTPQWLDPEQRLLSLLWRTSQQGRLVCYRRDDPARSPAVTGVLAWLRTAAW